MFKLSTRTYQLRERRNAYVERALMTTQGQQEVMAAYINLPIGHPVRLILESELALFKASCAEDDLELEYDIAPQYDINLQKSPYKYSYFKERLNVRLKRHTPAKLIGGEKRREHFANQMEL